MPENFAVMNLSAEKPGIWQRSPIIRFFRWLFTWRTIRRCILSVACLTAFITLFYIEENWRGRRAWENYRREWEAKGERFEMADFIPPPVPDDQNFAMTPFLAILFDYEIDLDRDFEDPKFFSRRDPRAYEQLNRRLKSLSLQEPSKGYKAYRKHPSLGDWREGQSIDLKQWQSYFRGSTHFPVAPQLQGSAKDILHALEKFDEELNEISTAVRRPYSQFAIHYDEGDFASCQHWSVLRDLVEIYRLRASARLALGKRNLGLDDIETCFRLAESIKGEPLLDSHFQRRSMTNLALQPVWEGLMNHQWSNPHLSRIERQLKAVNFLDGYLHASRGSRAWMNQTMFLPLRTRFMYASIFSDSRIQRDSFFRGGRVFLHLLLHPKGWRYAGLKEANQYYQEKILPTVDSSKQRVDQNAIEELDLLRNSQSSPPVVIWTDHFCHSVKGLAIGAAVAQTDVN